LCPFSSEKLAYVEHHLQKESVDNNSKPVKQGRGDHFKLSAYEDVLKIQESIFVA
jgi:hypothetical protein